MSFLIKNFNQAGIYLLKVNKRWNMFKVNNKDTKTTLMALFWCLSIQMLQKIALISNLGFQEDLEESRIYHSWVKVLILKAHSQVWDNFWQLKAL